MTSTLAPAAEVLAAARDHRATENAAAVEQFRLATEWAILHPASDLGDAAVVDGTQGELAIAGEGASLVGEFCVAELAAALQMSTDAGARYLGDAVETRFRLPRLWKQVMAGDVVVWKARKIAQQTKSLSPDAAAYVDRHLAAVAGRCSYAQIERTIAEALIRYDPQAAEQKRREAAERRHFDLDTHQVSFDGTVQVRGELDLADALDLDEAVAAGAQALAELGCTESLDVRRSKAAGELARREPVLDVTTHEPTPPATRRPRTLVIYAHLADDAIAGIAGIENTRTIASIEQVRSWCTDPDTQITLKPILDLNEHRHTTAYRPTDPIREQVILTHPTCVFPGCTRPSRGCDLDHIVAFDQGGPTCVCNLAPLCRNHHRLKTHGGWTYHPIGHHGFLWTSPMGQRYWRHP